MGGFGSGNHLGERRRFTVEESLVLGVENFHGGLQAGAAGYFRWPRGDVIDYRVYREGQFLALRLTYRWRGVDEVSIPIRLQHTSPKFGGRRWWFTCPLRVDGTPCGRRVRKLYLPPESRYFGCRHCHRLTYRSCQQAHKQERTARFLARQLGITYEQALAFAKSFPRLPR